jgi:DNA-binding MurR/RpiR family transcriptional regulator
MTAATSAEVLVTLRGIVPTLVPSLQRVAERILDDPSRAAAETISELARGATTSEATVLRLCRQLGIRGYRELRVALAAESGREQALSDTRDIGGDIGRTDDLDTVIDSVTYADQQAIADTARTIDRAALATAVGLVAGARRVDLVGVGASAVVALDLQQKLHRIGLIAFAWSDTHAALTAAALLGPADVMIGISHTGATRDTAEAIREASGNGAATIGLTSAPRSPLALQVDVLLVTAARETTFRSGATSSRIAALSVVDVLFVAVAQRRYDATVRALESTRNAVLPRRFDSSGAP